MPVWQPSIFSCTHKKLANALRTTASPGRPRRNLCLQNLTKPGQPGRRRTRHGPVFGRCVVINKSESESESESEEGETVALVTPSAPAQMRLIRSCNSCLCVHILLTLCGLLSSSSSPTGAFMVTSTARINLEPRTNTMRNKNTLTRTRALGKILHNAVMRSKPRGKNQKRQERDSKGIPTFVKPAYWFRPGFNANISQSMFGPSNFMRIEIKMMQTHKSSFTDSRPLRPCFSYDRFSSTCQESAHHLCMLPSQSHPVNTCRAGKAKSFGNVSGARINR